MWRPFPVDDSAHASDPAWAVIDGEPALLYVGFPIDCVQLAVEPGSARRVATYSVPYGRGPVAASPDGAHVVVTGGVGMGRTSWIFRTGTDQRVEVKEAGMARTVVVSPDGAWWAQSGLEVTVEAFGWDGRPTGGIHLPAKGEYFQVNHMALSPDGSFLVTADDGGFDQSEFGMPRAAGAPAIRAFDLTGPATERWSVDAEASHVAVSPDGGTVACSSRQLLLLDTATGELRRGLTAIGITDVAFLPDGRLVVLFNGAPALCDLETGALAPLPGAVGRASYLAVAPDGQLATAGGDGVVIWQRA
jgi:WD40 repeat protein